MNFEMDNLIVAFEVLKGNFEGLKEVQGWFDDENLPYEAHYTMTKDEALSYACGYHEHRIHSKQMFDLLRLYVSDFEKLIGEFKELEKASSVMSANGTDNA